MTLYREGLMRFPKVAEIAMRCPVVKSVLYSHAIAGASFETALAACVETMHAHKEHLDRVITNLYATRNNPIFIDGRTLERKPE